MLAMGPEAYWTFQGTAPGALLDQSGHGHHLTGHGTFSLLHDVPGMPGFQYVDLDGTSGYFDVASPAPFASAVFTVVSLCFPTASPGYIVANQPTASINSGFDLIVAAGSWGAGFGIRIGNGTSTINTLDTVPYGKHGLGFSMVGGAYDSQTVALYVNGEIQAATFAPGYQSDALGVQVGKARPSASYFRGGISDTAFFMRALSGAEWTRLAAQTGAPGAINGPELVALLEEIRAAVKRSWSA